jgi:pimeloyl-ACP methyl ester carboxylesterase
VVAVIWHETGGAGRRTVLLLHGVGATAAVWKGVVQGLRERGTFGWIVADLSGHGGSDWCSTYSVGEVAARLAELVRESREPLLVGHSLGAYVALALASGWFGSRIRGVLGLGPKIAWPAADLEAARELAARPPRHYATAEEAWIRYRRVSGVGSDAGPGDAWLARGVVHTEQGWRLAQDPRTFAAAGASFATLAASAGARVLLAHGERDPMVSLQELRAHSAHAYTIPGAGHNAHIEDPAAIVELIERLEAEVGAA